MSTEWNNDQTPAVTSLADFLEDDSEAATTVVEVEYEVEDDGKGGVVGGRGEVVRLEPVQYTNPLLDEREKDEANRRYFQLFVPVKSNTHRGGVAFVRKVFNAEGETFALKRPTYRSRNDFSTTADYEHYFAAENKAFEQEFKNQCVLSSLRGFPKPYGLGRDVEGRLYIIMEWVNGQTLLDARPTFTQMAGDGAFRTSPLLISQLGMAVFGLIARFEELMGGFVHRDISLRNIMLRTESMSVEEQIRKCTFDLCILDFGSGTQTEAFFDPSLTSVARIRRGATPEYAAPEMMARDLVNLYELRKSIKIDVYAISSVLYEMVSGSTPYRLRENNVSEDRVYRYKVDHEYEINKTPASAHADMTRLNQLNGEPGLIELAETMSRGGNFDERRFLWAVNEADTQFGYLLMHGLRADQGARADVAGMQAMLMRFFSQYLDNVKAAYNGERLKPFITINQPMRNGMVAGPAQFTNRVEYTNPSALFNAPATPIQRPPVVIRTFVPTARPVNAVQNRVVPNYYNQSTPVSKDPEGAPFGLRVALWIMIAVCMLGVSVVGALLVGGNELTLGNYSGTVSSAFAFLALLVPPILAAPAYLIPRKGHVAYAAGTLVFTTLQIVLWRLVASANWVNDSAEPVCTLLIVASTLCLALLSWQATNRTRR